MSGASSTFTSAPKAAGISLYLGANKASIPGDTDEFVSFTVASGKIRKIYSVNLDCRMSSRCKIYHESSLIASMRTGAGNFNGRYVFDLPYEISEGESFSVEVEYVDDDPVVETGVFVQLTEI